MNTQDDALISMSGKRIARTKSPPVAVCTDGAHMACFEDERRVSSCFRDAARVQLLWFTDQDIAAFARWAGAPEQMFYLTNASPAKRQRIAAWYVIYRVIGPRHLPVDLATNP